MWSGHCFSEVALWWQSRGSIGRAVSGNDCRIRAGADRGTEQKRKATQSAAGSGEYTFRSSVRLPLCEEDGHFCRLLLSAGKPSRRGSHGVRDVYQTTAQYQSDCTFVEPARNSHKNRKNAMGAIDGMGHLAQSGVPRHGLLWKNRTAAAATHHAVVASEERRTETQ